RLLPDQGAVSARLHRRPHRGGISRRDVVRRAHGGPHPALRPGTPDRRQTDRGMDLREKPVGGSSKFQVPSSKLKNGELGTWNLKLGTSKMAIIDDTYAEAFRSIYAAVLITARDRYWLDKAVNAATGNASSTILCDCEAGLDRYTDDTPDGRPGAVVQFHVPRFHKDREKRLERSVLVRVSQNVL